MAAITGVVKQYFLNSYKDGFIGIKSVYVIFLESKHKLMAMFSSHQISAFVFDGIRNQSYYFLHVWQQLSACYKVSMYVYAWLTTF